MTETALTRSSDGFDRPWTYNTRSVRRYVPYGAAVFFTCTGLLGLPFALFGVLLGVVMVADGSVLPGLGLLGLIGWGVLLLMSNLVYLVMGRVSISRLHWLSTAAYHVLFGGFFAVMGFTGEVVALVFAAPYLLMSALALWSYSDEKKAALLESEVEYLRLTDP